MADWLIDWSNLISLIDGLIVVDWSIDWLCLCSFFYVVLGNLGKCDPPAVALPDATTSMIWRKSRAVKRRTATNGAEWCPSITASSISSPFFRRLTLNTARRWVKYASSNQICTKFYAEHEDLVFPLMIFLPNFFRRPPSCTAPWTLSTNCSRIRRISKCRIKTSSKKSILLAWTVEEVGNFLHFFSKKKRKFSEKNGRIF